MSIYGRHVNDERTDQRVRARPEQVENSAGGFVFAVDCWTQLDRFLVLGAQGGTYYATERELTVKNADCVRTCIALDGPRTVRRIVEISDVGRAPKNDPAIFALAMCTGAKDTATRTAALTAIPKVCRIGTHLFHYAQDVEGFRRWGRGLRSAIAKWYTERSAESLALQAIKYQQRDGWSHRDLLRLSHAAPRNGEQAAMFRWMTAGGQGVTKGPPRGYGYAYAPLPAIVQAFDELHALGATDPKRSAALIQEHGLPHECVPNELKSRPEIWEAMLGEMGVTAMIRNLGKMTAVGLLKPLSSVTKLVTDRLGSLDVLKRGRVHPIAVLLASTTYSAGRGVKGHLSWSPTREIVDSLDEAFYLAFDTIVPTGKTQLLALDVSGSMTATIGGTHLSCRAAAAAMAMVTARTESRWHCVAFTAGVGGGYGGRFGGSPCILQPLSISPKQRLTDIVKACEALPMGGTDCSLPMLYAANEGLEVDAFYVYTDNETWYGAVHPFQALKVYRAKSGRNAKLVVVGMTATEFTIAEPNDQGMLDVVGFDSHAPAIAADFVRGNLTSV
jgi:60 kDa SS-A/Ro ribonucleoprotein